MNDAELNQLLKSAESPSRNREYWADFPGQVALQLNRPLRRELPAKRWAPRLAWAGGLAAVCVLAGFLIGHKTARTELAANEQALQSEKLIREVMTMFPNRVRAIVKDEAGMQLMLSESEDVPASTPLWVKVCRAGQCTTLVTFSGQELQIAGQKMTVLADAEGGVILMGERFAWTSEGPKSGAQDLKIQAKPLQLALR